MLRNLFDMLLSLLPERYRRAYQVNPVGGTTRSGIAEAAVALVVYIVLYFRYLESFGAFSGGAMVGAAGAEMHSTAFGLGIIGWLSFSITPGPLAAMYCMIEGTVRAIHGGLVHEPLASLPFWLIGRAHNLVDRRRAKRRLAEPKPDLVELGQPGSGWDLRVTSVRPKEGWHARVQIEYNGVFYAVSSSGEEVWEGKPCFRYCLKKAAVTEGYHGIIHYDPFDYWKASGE